MMFDAQIAARAEALLAACRSRRLTLATAESCTGGLVAGALTSIAGASDVFEAGFVTYSNAAKTRHINVAADIIAAHGAVSEETARAMAEGTCAATGAGLVLAVTGIAGPAGGSEQKPVGLVHIAAARIGRPTIHARLLLGNPGREAIRLGAVAEVLALGLRQAETGEP